MDEMPITRLIKRGDCEIAIAEAGEGETIIFAHGYPQNRRMWRHQFTELAKTYRVVAFDWPGWGGSTVQADTSHRYEAEVERMAAVADAVGADKPHWVLHDYGGYVGLGFLAKYPERAASVCMLNSRAHRTFPGWVGSLTRAVLGAVSSPVLGWLVAVMTPLGLLHRLGLRYFRSNGPLVDYTSGFARPEGRLAWRRAMSHYHLPARPELLEAWKQLNVASLIVFGDDDIFCPFETAEELAAAAAHGALIRIEGGDHFPAEEHAERVTEELLAFFKRMNQGAVSYRDLAEVEGSAS